MLLRRTREYDARDLEGCEVLQAWPASVEGGRRKADDPLSLSEHEPDDQRDLRHVKDFAMTGGGLVCSTRVRHVLEASGLHGMKFMPTRLMPRGTARRVADESVPWETFGEPWWEMVSDVVLPFVSPTVQKRSARDGRLLPREYAEGPVYFVDGDYSDYELHFVRSELEQLPGWDVARTREGRPGVWMVVSKRFYDVIRGNKFECGLRPVRIDEG